MNYVKLVEDGVYKKENLTDKDRNFINGMEYVLKEVITEDFFSEKDFNIEFSPTFAKIQMEIANKVIEELREYLYVTICENIVEMIDTKEEE